MMLDPFANTEDGSSSAHADEGLLLQISQDYLRALEQGLRPNREEYLRRCPMLRDRAIECLAGVELAFSMKKVPKHLLDPPKKLDHAISEPLGDFRIVQEIGRGGMGVVYEAVQLSLARSVALKVLPFASALDERHRKRFLVEAQSAAQLHHPNIVPVYAVGCERGTHFYAMQLINGQPISAAVFDELSRGTVGTSIDQAMSTSNRRAEPTLAEFNQNSVSRGRMRDRNRIIASLIAQAADALEYAHSCGIVHRDVKPGNLLLDVQGKLWITDFGLAQIATGDHMTQTGDLLGTLRYMSPEQASGSRGVIDHRSDIYSLGATLYEMLTRKPVFEGHNRQELLHQIFNEEPIPLRKRDRSIPEELEIITLKALRQSASDRYESSQAFADDLRRYLNENPILARRPSMTDKTRKWMRRHPSTVLSVLFALVAIVVSLAIVTVTVTHQKSLTADSLIREQHRVQQAEKRLSIAQAAADEMIRMAENELSISPMEEALRQRLLTSAIKYYQSIIDETNDDAETQRALIATRDRAQKILSQLDVIQKDRLLQLLDERQVQADLGLTVSQVEVLKAKANQTSHDGKPASSHFAGHDRLLSELKLTDAQLARLKQISVQLQGPPGLRDLVVSGQLQLSSEQLEAIQSDIIDFITKTSFPFLMKSQTDQENSLSPSEPEIGRGALDSIAAILGTPNPRSVRSPEDLINPEIKSALMEVLLRRLTPEQLGKWREITGTKFEAMSRRPE